MRMSKCKVKSDGTHGSDEGLEARLKALRLFAGMSAREVAEVIGRVGGTVRRFDKGEVIVYEGTKAKWVVPVLGGRLTVFESGASGARHPVRVVEAGQCFGATMVTANLEYYPGMATATVPSEVVFLDIGKLKTLWREARYAKLFENLYSVVSAEVLACWRKMSILSCKKTEDRFMLYLRWRTSEAGASDVQVPFTTSEAFAQYLGVTRTGLSLAVKRLVARGEIVRPGQNRFVLCGMT